MTLTRAEERAYALAEAAATGIVDPGAPIPCSGCRGAGLVPSPEILIERRRKYLERASARFGFVPIRVGVAFCDVCGGNGETVLSPVERRERAGEAVSV